MITAEITIKDEPRGLLIGLDAETIVRLRGLNPIRLDADYANRPDVLIIVAYCPEGKQYVEPIVTGYTEVVLIVLNDESIESMHEEELWMDDGPFPIVLTAAETNQMLLYGIAKSIDERTVVAFDGPPSLKPQFMN